MILSKEELESLDFVEMKKKLVLYDPVGLGKTHNLEFSQWGNIYTDS